MQQQQQQQPNRTNSSSPFPTPSSSPGAVPPPDSEWLSGSEWSMGGSAQSSRAPSPFHPQALNKDQLANIGSYIVAQLQLGQFPQLPSPSTTPAPPSEPSSSRPASPAGPATPRKKVPRPANAFMLFRSDMIKKNKIPKTVEQRQQNISRVAGQCWNLLPPEKKAYWHQKAAEKLAEHLQMYPDYKFSPERKQARRKTSPGGEIPQQNTEEYIRYIRERYCGLAGPAVPPPRPRKPKSRRGADAHAQSAPPPMHFSLPPSLMPSPVPTPDVPRTASAPPTMGVSPEAHLAAMGPHGIPDYCMPPPGPGFPHNFSPESFAQYLTHAAQHSLHGDDTTPKAPTFNDPTQAKFTFNPAGEGSAEADLGLAQSYGAAASTSTATSQQHEGSSQPSSPGRWDSLDSYLAQAPLLSENGSSPHDALNVALDASAVYGTDAAALDNSELDAWYQA